MRLASVDRINPGMYLAKSIYGTAGQILLRKGVELKPHYTKYLKKMGITHVYISDSRVPEAEEIEDVIHENTKIDAQIKLSNIFDDCKNGGTSSKVVVDKQMEEITHNIIDDLLKNKEVIVQLSEIRSLDDYMVTHSINVTVLSLIILLKSNYPYALVKKYAPGYMLIDIGMVKAQESLLKNRELLTDWELEKLHQHPILGYEMFKNSSLFDEDAGNIILQHHERMNGQGYPYGLVGDEISYLARIAAVAEVYDSLVSPQPDSRALLPSRAIRIMQEQGSDYYDEEVLQLLFSFVAAYPVGTEVLLNNGDSGVVIGNTPGYPFNPKVKVLYRGEKKVPHHEPYIIDLAESIHLMVMEVIEDG